MDGPDSCGLMCHVLDLEVKGLNLPPPGIIYFQARSHHLSMKRRWKAKKEVESGTLTLSFDLMWSHLLQYFNFFEMK